MLKYQMKTFKLDVVGLFQKEFQWELILHLTFSSLSGGKQSWLLICFQNYFLFVCLFVCLGYIKIWFWLLQAQSYNNTIKTSCNHNIFIYLWSHSKLIEKLLDASDIYCLEIATTINLTGNTIFLLDGVGNK